jgi:hypothetical protein
MVADVDAATDPPIRCVQLGQTPDLPSAALALAGAMALTRIEPGLLT